MPAVCAKSLELSHKAVAMEVLKKALHSRFCDEKMMKLVKQNKGSTFQLSAAGHELVGVICAMCLTPGKDWGLPYYRDQPFAIGIGSSLQEIMAAFLARDVPHHSGGRMMPGHFSHHPLRIPCQSSVVGSQFLQAVGLAHGIRMQNLDEVVYVSGGDGSTSQGDFHEALNFAAIHALPVIFVIQDNGWAISVPVSEQTAGGCIAPIARGYPGMEVAIVDGSNALEIAAAMQPAVQRARQQMGPSVIVAKVPRLSPHSNSDDALKYKTQDMIAAYCDPIASFERFLIENAIASIDEIKQMRSQAFEEVEVAAFAADQLPHPHPDSASEHVFVDVEELTEMDAPVEGEKIVIMDALNHALEELMEEDAGVVVFGQDVAKGKGGVFGITRRLTERFGASRCFNTPLAESTIVGLAIGMSFDQFHKPVAEIQFADYLWTGINQLFNELSSIHYRSKGQWRCPVVLRMPYGGYIQGGPYHSQSIEGFLAHCPGLKIVIPSNAADAKGLLKAAVKDPNPVIFLEHKGLYRQQKFCARPEPGREFVVPLGKARVVRPGSDASVICWGMMVVMACQIAEKLQNEGISVEVIDVRSIVPLDRETLLASVAKTSKVLIAQEAQKNGGFASEIAAMIAENAFSKLDAPIMRLGALDAPVPYSKVLEEAVLPQSKDLEKAIRQLVAY